jgi:protein-disulfide isomerase
MKSAYVMLAAAAIFASAACNAEKGSNASAAANNTPIKAIKAPNGDWSKLVSRTEAGGYVMGNPNADVKLVEFGSLTCPHCAAFDAEGADKLVNNYVKTGRVSWEFRNFVRDPFDLTASLLARCSGPDRFFPLAHELYADQRNWTSKIQEIPQDQFQALQGMGPEKQFLEIAKLSQLQQWAAQRGLPSGKSNVCLTNQQEINLLVQMNGDTTTQYPEFTGTPSFVINGKMLKETATWDKLEPQLRDALGS